MLASVVLTKAWVEVEFFHPVPILDDAGLLVALKVALV
jgi:hypothetical protein